MGNVATRAPDEHPGQGDGSALGSVDEVTCRREALLRDWVTFQHFTEIDSTQSYVERAYASFDQEKLTVVSADFQTGGRGTGERKWEAAVAASILMTFFFRFPARCKTPFVNRNVPNVTKVLACAAVSMLRRASSGLPNEEGRACSFGIKWPNDVICDDKKIGGILARAVPAISPGECRLDGVIVGIGININTPASELAKIARPVWPATSLLASVRAQEAPSPGFDVEALRRELAGDFAHELQTFFEEGFPAFRERVNGMEVLLGRPVRFRLHPEEELDGTFEGVDDGGHILIREDLTGRTRAHPSGEIVPRGPAPPRGAAGAGAGGGDGDGDDATTAS